jgi:hypothetical protein
MERPAGVSIQPFDHLGMLVDGVVVEDGVDGLADRDLALDGVQTRHALFHEPRLPAPDGGLADTGCAHDRCRTQPVGRGQHDPGALYVLLGAVAVVNDHLQALAIGRVQVDDDASAHPEDSHTGKLVGIPQRTLMSASIH